MRLGTKIFDNSKSASVEGGPYPPTKIFRIAETPLGNGHVRLQLQSKVWFSVKNLLISNLRTVVKDDAILPTLQLP